MRRNRYALAVAVFALAMGRVFAAPIAWARYAMYLRYVIRHKWFVLIECAKLRVPLLTALLHDWDKFMPDEWVPYAQTFYNEQGGSQYKPENGMDVAWNHHQKRNKHHWQYWMLTWDHGGTDCLPMPDLYRREMLADWRGAGLALGKPDTLAWYTANRDKMLLHQDTRQWIEAQLGYETQN